MGQKGKWLIMVDAPVVASSKHKHSYTDNV